MPDMRTSKVGQNSRQIQPGRAMVDLAMNNQKTVPLSGKPV
jgi:hypothetical protein